MTLGEYLNKSGLTLQEYYDKKKRESEGKPQTLKDYTSSLLFDLNNEDLSDVADTLSNSIELDYDTYHSYKDRVGKYINSYDQYTKLYPDSVNEDFRGYLGQLNDAISANDNVFSGFDSKEAYDKAVKEYEHYQNETIVKQTAMEADARNDPYFDDYSARGKTVKGNVVEGAISEANNILNGYEGYGLTIGEQNRDNALAMWGSRQRTNTEDMILYSGYMTPDEVATYNYYIAKEAEGYVEKGTSEAYLKAIRDALNKRKAGQIFESVRGNTAQEMVFGIEAGLDQFKSGMKNLFNTKDSLITPSARQMASGMVREDLGRTSGNLFGSSFGQAGYDLITTTANMLPSILASTISGMAIPGSGEVVGAGLMGSSAAGNAYQEMLNLGYNKSQARVYSSLTGVSEAGLQYALGGVGKLGGKLSGKLGGKAVNSIAKGINNAGAQFSIKYGGKLLANMGSEGLEEFLQDVLDPFFKSIATGEKPEGVDWEQAAYSGFLGALSAGILDAPGQIGRGGADVISAAIVKAKGRTESIKKIGNTFSADSIAYKIADKVTPKTSVLQLAMLIHDANANISEQNRIDIKHALEEKGITGKDADTISTWIARVVDGAELTESQIAALDENPVIAEVFRDTIIDKNSTINQRIQARLESKGITGQVGVDLTSVGEENGRAIKNAQERMYAGQRILDTLTGRYAADEDSVERIKAEAKRASAAKAERTATDTATTATDTATDANSTESDNGLKAINAVVAEMGVSDAVAKELVGMASTNTDKNPEYIARGLRDAYWYGAHNIRIEELSKGVFTSELTEEQRNRAYQLGKESVANTQKQTRKVEDAQQYKGEHKVRKNGKIDGIDTYKLNDVKRIGVTLARILAHLGADVYVYESTVAERAAGKANGYFVDADGTIHIDLNSGKRGEGLVAYTIAHEFVHDIERESPELFKAYADILVDALGETQSVSELIEGELERLRNDEEYKDFSETKLRDLAYSEVIAKASEKIFTDTDVLNRIAERIKAENRPLWKKIVDFFTGLVERLKEAYKGQKANSYIGEIAAETISRVEAIRDAFVNAAVDTLNKHRSARTDVLHGGADGAVIANDATASVARATEMKSTRTENTAYPKMIMGLDGVGQLAYIIDGLKATKIAGLAPGKDVNGYTVRQVRDFAMKNGEFTQEQINEMNRFMDTMAKFMEEAGVTYKFIGLNDVSKATLQYSYNDDGSIKSIVLSAMVKNGEYPVNFDLSSICKQREPMSRLINKLANRGDLDNGTVDLSQKNIFEINKALKEAGYETACLGCFVESKRYNMKVWSETFCEKWNNEVRKINPNATYFNYGAADYNGEVTLDQAIKMERSAEIYNKKAKATRLENAIKKYREKEKKGVPLMEKFSAAAIKRLNESNLTEEQKDYYISTDPSKFTLKDIEILLDNDVLPGASLSSQQAITSLVGSGEPYQHLLKPSDLLTAKGIEKLMGLPNFYGVLYGHYGSGTPKLMQGFTPYNSEIALLPSQKGNGKDAVGLVEYLYSIAGVRMQSFSDFQVQNIYDYLQIVGDLAARRLPAHAYTKVLAFAKLLGMTGVKINMSTMFDIDPSADKEHAGLTKLNPLVHRGEYAVPVLIDENGVKWVYNVGDYTTQNAWHSAYPDEAKRFIQSIGFADAVRLQTTPGYSKNCGIIGVGYSDLHILAMLDDGRIRYIIPYHASSLPAEIKVATHIELATDFTPYQNLTTVVSITNAEGNTVKWDVKEAYKRLGSGKAVMEELNDGVKNNGWKIDTKKTENGHGSYELYENLKETSNPKKTAENFMDWCCEKGVLPVFYQFAYHENYYKLLYDFNVYDCITGEYAPQEAVTNTYPTMVDGEVRPADVTEGGFDADHFKQTIEKQMAAMNSMYSRLDEDLETLADNLENGKASIAESNNGVEMLKNGDNIVLKSDRESSEQKITSAKTSIRQVPALFNNSLVKFGKTNVDIGGGRFDLATEQLARRGTTNYIFDPFNRSEEENSAALKIVMNGGADTATCANVLNVIAEEGARRNVILETAKSIKQGGTAYFMVYEGNGTGIGKETSAGWQNNRKTEDYVVEIEQFFDNVTRRGKLIIATEPKSNLPKANWETSIGNITKYSNREDISNRDLLANALETAAQTDSEKDKLNQYKTKIGLMEQEEKRLSEVKAKIKELSFAKGTRDVAKINSLQETARRIENSINRYDKALFNLEATTALKNVLKREYAKAENAAKQRYQGSFDAYRQRTNEKIRGIIQKNQESRAKGIESRSKTELRGKIRGVVSELNKLLLHGTKERNVKLGLQEAVASALDAINFDTVGAENRLAAIHTEMEKKGFTEELLERYNRVKQQGDNLNEKLRKLKEAYEGIKNQNNKEAGLYKEYADNIIARVESTIEKTGKTPIRDMSVEQLTAVYDLYKLVLHTVRDANKIFREGKYEEISTNASGVISEVSKFRPLKQVRSVLSEKVREFFWNEAMPVYAFERIGSATMKRMFWDLVEAQNTYGTDVNEVDEFARKTRAKYGFDGWDFKTKEDFTLPDGKVFSLDLEDKMMLYAHSKDPENVRHAAEGGFFFDDKETFRKKHGLIEYVNNDTNAYKTDDAVLAKISASLTEEQRNYVDEMQGYWSTEMAKKGNEAARVIWGIDIFTKKVYSPLKSKMEFIYQANQPVEASSLKNDGMTKERKPGANNPIILEKFDSVWESHCERMCKYHSFVVPIDNLNKVMNYGTWIGDDAYSVSITLEKYFGKACTNYIEDFIKDLNGAKKSAGGAMAITASMFTKFKKTAVAINSSVTLQQPTSVIRAMSVIPPVYFRVESPKLSKEKYELMRKYAPICIIKEIGGIEVGAGRSTVEWLGRDRLSGVDKVLYAIDDFTSKGAEYGDKYGWTVIWNACERKVLADKKNTITDAKEYENYSKSEDFHKDVGKLFTKAIVYTQVYDSTLSRSAYMRSKSDIVKMETAFGGEPALSFNILYDSVLQAKRHTMKKSQAIRNVACCYAALVTAAIASSLVYANRDDDDDESYIEKFGESFFNKVLGVGSDLLPTSMLPFVKDIASLIDGWDVERADMAVFADVISAIKGIGSERKSAYEKIEALANAFSLFTIPLRNLLRSAREIYNLFKSVFTGNLV